MSCLTGNWEFILLIVLLFWKALTLARVHQHASAECPELYTLGLTQHHQVQLICITLTLMIEVLHMSHISRGPPTQDGRNKPHISKESLLHPHDGEHSPHRSEITPDRIFRGAVHHFLCVEIRTTLLVDRIHSMQHGQITLCRHLNTTSRLPLMITLPCPCISLTFGKDSRR